jgi:hypothetical protein
MIVSLTQTSGSVFAHGLAARQIPILKRLLESNATTPNVGCLPSVILGNLSETAFEAREGSSSTPQENKLVRAGCVVPQFL